MSTSRRLAAASAALLAFVAACATPPPPVTPKPPPVAVAPKPPPSPDDALSDAPMPLDARVTKGVLPSGLTYYVLAHNKPEHRAQMWLVVNAGSVLEDDDQRGLAHFVEHMGFNGTTHFSKNALIDTLEKMGVSFGADLNAHTSFDETVYTLTVPTDKPELVDTAVRVLRDWSDGMTFDPVEVDKERGVVLEEWRLGRGAGRRLLDKQAPVFFNGSKYADRITIGLPEIIKGAPRDALVRFYKDWYRPDLMAVVCVGDFEPKEIEQKIKAEFATLKPATSPRPRAVVTVPPHDDVRVSIETDPEATSTSIAILTEVPHRTLASERDYRRAIRERLFAAMVNARFAETRADANAPFIGASTGVGRYVRTEDVFVLSARVKVDGVERGYSALLEEMRRVEQHGFLPAELERAKSNTLRSYERAVKQRATTDGRALANEIVRNFLEGESMPGAEAELEFAKKVLPTITLDELDALGKSLAKGSRVVSVTGPASMKRPDPAALIDTAKAIAARDVAPYKETVPAEPLLPVKPTRGPVVATRTIPELEVTEWTLKNGVRVVVKPTDFKDDEVLMAAFAPGGTSLAKDDEFESARWASFLVNQGGLANHGELTVKKMLAGKVAWMGSRMSELEEGLSGGASPEDLETMFELVHLYFTQPRRDQKAFDAFLAEEAESLKNKLLSPDNVFHDELTRFLTQNHKRRQPETLESIKGIDLDKAMAFYKARFADASNFTFVFVGNVDLDELKDLSETYLGSLPSSNKKETWADIKLTRPKGVAKKSIVKGTEPKSQVSLTFHGPAAWSRESENDVRALGEVLRIRLREVLREDMGGVYGVSASGSITRRPKQEVTFTVSFGCAPENVDKLEKAVFDEIQSLQKSGVASDVLDKIKEQRRRAHETMARTNSYWLGELERAYTFGDDPKLILDWEAMSKLVTSDRLKDAAKKYLSKKQYALAELRPETK